MIGGIPETTPRGPSLNGLEGAKEGGRATEGRERKGGRKREMVGEGRRERAREADRREVSKWPGMKRKGRREGR